MSLSGGGSGTSSRLGVRLGGRPVPLGSTTTHEPTWVFRSTWTRWKSLDATTNEDKVIKMII
ncbi:MAG: hypothetical protein QXY48_02385 [Sulfolobales archaeon]